MAKPTSIANLLNSLIASKGWRGKVELHKVFGLWDDIVGKDVARQAQPYVIRKTVLWIKVSDSVWMQQLHLLKEMILEKINNRLKREKFTDLRFQLDSCLGEAPDGSPASPPVLWQYPNQEKRDEFEQLLESIKDDDIRKAMMKCWLKVGNVKRKD